MAFETKGEVPEWRLVYQHIAGLPIDASVSYETLDEILGRPFRDNRQPLYRANQELLDNEQRCVANRPGVGYRVVRANEHAGLAEGQRRGARRKMTKAVRISSRTDRGALTPEERKRIDSLEHNLRQQAAALRKQDQRLGDVEKEVIRQDDRVDHLVRQLRAKGIDLDPTT